MSSLAQRTEVIVHLVNNRIPVPGSTIVFSAACFEGNDWSLKRLYEPKDAIEHKGFVGRVGLALRGLDARRVYSPSPHTFNGRIMQTWNLDRRFALGYAINLYRNPDHPADGTYLKEAGDAGIFSAAGCSIIVTTFRDRLIFAHAGRDCVLDRKRVETNGIEQSRTHQSVVDSILEGFDVFTTTEFDGVHAWVFYSIRPEDFVHRFDDPIHGAWNAAAARYIPSHFGEKAGRRTSEGIEIDVPEISKAQFLEHGVPETNIHLEHAYLSDELPTTRNGMGGRYLAAVVRHT